MQEPARLGTVASPRDAGNDEIGLGLPDDAECCVRKGLIKVGRTALLQLRGLAAVASASGVVP